MDEGQNQRIPCMRCKHYQTTFEAKAPRACTLYQFKSAIMPYILVKQSTGSDCPSFSEKAVKKDKDDGKKDFNDPKYW